MVTLRVRHLHQIKGRWYWIPSKSAKELGFRSEALGVDLFKARKRAEHLNEQMDQERHRRVKPTQDAEQRTIKDLIADYKKDDKYTKQKPVTRQGYSYRLKLIEQKAGGLNVAEIERTDLVQTYRALKEKYNTPMAASMMRVWRILMKHAYDIGWAKINHASEIGISAASARSTLWTPEEVNELIAVAVANSRPSVALAAKLAYDSGQRPTDVLRLTWSQWDGSGFWVKQSKTGQKVFAPVSPELAAELNAMTKEGVQIVLSDRKRPYSRPHFSREFAEARDLAKLHPDLQFRDMRRTAATELGEAHATDDEIRAVTGHKSRAVVAVYVQPSKTMSEAAQRKRFAKKSLNPGE